MRGAVDRHMHPLKTGCTFPGPLTGRGGAHSAVAAAAPVPVLPVHADKGPGTVVHNSRNVACPGRPSPVRRSVLLFFFFFLTRMRRAQHPQATVMGPRDVAPFEGTRRPEDTVNGPCCVPREHRS